MYEIPRKLRERHKKAITTSKAGAATLHLEPTLNPRPQNPKASTNHAQLSDLGVSGLFSSSWPGLQRTGLHGAVGLADFAGGEFACKSLGFRLLGFRGKGSGASEFRKV